MGWEMFVLASIALSWCLPSFTVSIFWSDWDLNKYGLWNVCKLTEDSFLTGDRVCFELQTNIIWEGFAFICVGALLLYGVRMCVSVCTVVRSAWRKQTARWVAGLCTGQ